MRFYIDEEESVLIKEAIKKSEYKTQKNFAEKAMGLTSGTWEHRISGRRGFGVLEVKVMKIELSEFVKIDTKDNKITVSKIEG